VPYEDLAGADDVPVGHRVGGWVIHFPAVVCTSSPNTTTNLEPILPARQVCVNGLCSGYKLWQQGEEPQWPVPVQMVGE